MQATLGSRLRDALRLAVFAKVPEERLRTSWIEIMAAVFLALGVPTIYALLELGSEGTWSLHGIPGTLFFVPVFLLGGAIVARIVKRDDAVPTFFFGALLAWIVIDAVSLSGWALVGVLAAEREHHPLEFVFFYVPLAWFALAVARFATVIAPVGGGRQMAALAAAVAFLAFPFAYLHPERSVWVQDWSRKANDGDARAMMAATDEAALYRQPALLAEELAAVTKGRPGIVDVFFIGMAGHGYQDVFMREVDSVARLMRERFGAEGRTVKLINNPKTVMSSPIASLTGLQEALRRTAAQMDIEEDVLVLFLTSHGSADHKFSLDLYPIKFKDIDPATLRRALDDSGIRNRVVIISACYAGGFAEKLKDPNTLVIAAAAPDRNSFGCSNEAEWTYFGKAYFDDALRQTHSFTGAFEAATTAIGKRETSEKQTPSKPLMVVGEGIGGTLTRLEKQLAAGAAAVTPQAPRARDAYERYVDISFSEAYTRDWERQCRDSMRLTSPDVWLDKDPGVFGGLNRSSHHWSKLASAWERHSEEFCRKANDPALLRSVYAEQVRAVMSEKELDPILAFLITETGKRWFDKEHEVVRRHAGVLGKRQAALSEESYRTYVADQAKIFAAFRTDGERKNNKGRLGASTVIR